MKRLLQLYLTLFFCAFSVLGAVTATIDRQSMVVGDTATLQLRIYDARPQSLPNFPAPPNLSIQFAGQGTEYRSVNGKSSTALVMSYGITASAPGTYTIPSIQIPLAGASYSTQPLTITVTKDDAAGARAAFIQIIPSKTNVFVGEMFPIEIRVYGLVIEQLYVPVLKSDGFTIGTQGSGVQMPNVQFGNNFYQVYSFSSSISAAKAGNLALGPAEAGALIRIQNQATRRNLLDEFFGGFQRKQVTLTSDPVPIQVSPLPSENVPPNFNGAIGSFQLEVKASATNVAVGDPITLGVKIQGRGAFDTLKLPDLNWKDFTFYQPNSTVTNLDALGLQAIKTFDQVVVPQRAGLSMIPPLIFSFFDPDLRAYKTVQTPAIPISVRSTGHGQAQPTVVAEQNAQTPQGSASDIVHIKPTLGNMVALAAPLPLRPSFIVLSLVPIAIWGGALVWRKRTNQLANDPRLRRKREVSRLVGEGLAHLRQAAARNDSQSFFATGFRLLQEQIGERLDLPAAAITEAVLDDKLQGSATPELIQRLHELFQACNQARYAGLTIAGMEALIPKFEAALSDIQKVPDRP